MTSPLSPMGAAEWTAAGFLFGLGIILINALVALISGQRARTPGP